MKDIVISGKTIKRELVIFALCLAAAEICNLFAIVKYSRPAVELLSQLGFVVILAALIYFTAWIVRILVKIIIKLIKNTLK